jgi:putative PEP-CTERM system histidine kinase
VNSYHPTIFFIPALLAVGLAVAIIFREGKRWAHRCFVLGLLLLAAESAACGFSLLGLTPDERISFQILHFGIAAFLPVTWVAFSLLYSRGNSAIFLKKWRGILIFLGIAPIVVLAISGTDLVMQELRDPAGNVIYATGLGGVILEILILTSAVVTLMNLERTFKASVGTMRWQIKFMLLGVAAIFGARIYTASQVILFRSITFPLELINSTALFLGCVLLIRALTRAGLFKVDVYPSERVLQSSIAGLLAGAYLLVVGVFARVVSKLGGDSAFALKAFLIILGLAGLAVLLLSERLRQHVHDFVARHFARPHYDYRTAWLTLTERTASILDPEQLSRTIANWISETLHVLSVTIWLLDEQSGELNLVASTCFTETISPAEGSAQQSVVHGLSQSPDPFIVEDKRAAWVETLKGYYADYFKSGGSRVCVPLLAGGKVAGMITLGDRVNAAPYGGEELDLLKCIGEQFASNLLNLKLSTELVQAKELEAFQTISAFFVHDLKNTASTLSLMLQNFRTHIDNPEFREDALRAISKATNHIQELIQRLSMVRQRLELRKKGFDLNDLLKTSTECLAGRPGVKVVQDLATMPRVDADPEQLNKVFTNLLLNAAEAVSNQGEVRLSTCQQNGWLVVSVADNGCGMSPEFIKRSLFRPFHSTKKGGLGIGMFHTRMIVEAHKGKIEVQSEPGVGTSFRVLLPAATPA